MGASTSKVRPRRLEDLDSLVRASKRLKSDIANCAGYQPAQRNLAEESEDSSVSGFHAPSLSSPACSLDSSAKSGLADAESFASGNHSVCSDESWPHNVQEFGPPVCPCESQRLETVRALQIIDGPPDPEIDNVLSVVRKIFHTDTSLVTLFDDRKVYISHAQGAVQPGDAPWRWSFCGWLMASANAQVLVVEDTHADSRFRNNPFVISEPNIRFYCGAPLLASNGHRLGSLCFIDTKPRRFDAYSCNILSNLATCVAGHLEKFVADHLRAQAAEQQKIAEKLLRRVAVCAQNLMLLVDGSVPGARILCGNEAWKDLCPDAKAGDADVLLVDMFELDDEQQRVWRSALATGEVDSTRFTDARLKMQRETHSEHALGHLNFDIQLQPAWQQACVDPSLLINVPTFLSMTNPGYKLFLVVAEQTPASALESKQSLAAARQQHRTLLVPLVKELAGLELDTLLGAGAYGQVYYGSWYGTEVAVKVCPFICGSRSSESLAWEGLLTQSLAHPNIVRTLTYALVPAEPDASGRPDCGDSCSVARAPQVAGGESAAAPDVCSSLDGSEGKECELWIVMEFCNRGTLHDAVDRGWMQRQPGELPSVRTVDPQRVARTALEVARALQHLHGRGWVHGDLNPFNVLLATDAHDTLRGFVAKVADFGLSRPADWHEKLAAQQYGTVTHVAPEVLARQEVSCQADVYSFGVVLWQLLTGSRPWVGLSHSQIIHAVAHEKRTLRLPDGHHPVLARLVAECTRHDPAARPSASALVQQLAAVAGHGVRRRQQVTAVAHPAA